MTGTTPCPVGDCCSPVRSGQLMCLAHWRATPRLFQEEVNRTWRSFSRPSKADRLALLKAYRAARDAALAYHEQREGARG